MLRLTVNATRKDAQLVQFLPNLLCDLLLPVYVVTFILNHLESTLFCNFTLPTLVCGAWAQYTPLWSGYSCRPGGTACRALCFHYGAASGVLRWAPPFISSDPKQEVNLLVSTGLKDLPITTFMHFFPRKVSHSSARARQWKLNWRENYMSSILLSSKTENPLLKKLL